MLHVVTAGQQLQFIELETMHNLLNNALIFLKKFFNFFWNLEYIEWKLQCRCEILIWVYVVLSWIIQPISYFKMKIPLKNPPPHGWFVFFDLQIILLDGSMSVSHIFIGTSSLTLSILSTEYTLTPSTRVCFHPFWRCIKVFLDLLPLNSHGKTFDHQGNAL